MRALRSVFTAAALLSVLLGSQVAQAAAWSFAVMADSQPGGSDYYDNNILGGVNTQGSVEAVTTAWEVANNADLTEDGAFVLGAWDES